MGTFDDITLEEGARIAKNVGHFLLGVGMFWLTFSWGTPVDIYSTALWMDSLDYNRVFDSSSTILSFIDFPRSASEESVFLSLAVYLVVIALFLIMSRMGGWITNDPNIPFHVFLYRYIKGSVRNNQINWNKVGLMAIIVGLTIFDVYTDGHWKTGGVAPFSIFVRNLLISFLLQTILSEVMWILSFMLLGASISGGWQWLKGRKVTRGGSSGLPDFSSLTSNQSTHQQPRNTGRSRSKGRQK